MKEIQQYRQSNEMTIMYDIFNEEIQCNGGIIIINMKK